MDINDETKVRMMITLYDWLGWTKEKDQLKSLLSNR